ncbi:MAG: hypothetical protein A2161_06500 [Candidatus Schekmanbacteria bacterium RBG_13_48_7]|uniref:Tetratricopeptide repeat-like domain-containing protein n=1 Tax=Candidatus Schekmanbacteria bacterium RBG_13_48_7 TaxID=1817878 RepID=A0A1F7S9U2_9BACT|nr:MAG: hypothetical protein A2161_06500 [Candidatus Schekmanbacteria bacterium RBG_13_48_7]
MSLTHVLKSILKTPISLIDYANRYTSGKKGICIVQIVVLVLGIACIWMFGLEYFAERKLSNGVIYLKKNQLLAARLAFENIYTFEPSQQSRVNLFWGQTLVGLENYSAAMHHLKTGMNRLQDDKFYFWLGKVYSKLFLMDEAIKSYEKSYWFNPNFKFSREELSKIYLERAAHNMDKGNTKIAYKNVLQSFQYFPHNPESYLMAGKIEMKNERWDDAEKWFELGLQYNPGDYQLNLNLIKTAMSLESYDKALDIIRALYFINDPGINDEIIAYLFSISYLPDQDLPWALYLADLLLDKGNKNLGCKLLDESDPDQNPVFYSMVRLKCSKDLHEREECCANAERLIGAYPPFFSFIDRYQKYCESVKEYSFKNNRPSSLIYRPLLYGKLFYKIILLGYSLQKNQQVNLDKLQINLYLLSVADLVQIPQIVFMIENHDKVMLIEPEIFVNSLKPDWRPYETQRLQFALKIPEIFRTGNFSISVSFASNEMKRSRGKVDNNVGFVPVFRIEHVKTGILVSPVENEETQ